MVEFIMADRDDDLQDLIAMACDYALDHPRTQELVDRTVAAIEHAPQALFGKVMGAFRQPQMTSRPVRIRAPTQDPLALARAALHFDQEEPLTLEKIKLRKRALSRQLHPDRGGDPGIMTRINAAATVLTKHLKDNQ